MDITFIGHQSFMVHHGATRILVDPLLEREFGLSQTPRLEVFPSRTVDLKAMPCPDAIVLSHEHPDHFHVPSLARIARSTPILLAPLMPSYVEEALLILGFSPRRLTFGETVTMGDLALRPSPPPAETPLWERRVAQLFFTTADGCGGVFMTIDAPVPRDADIDPRLVVVANNSQFAPPGAVHANANAALRRDDRFGLRHAGLNILRTLLLESADAFPRSAIAISGGGFIDAPESFGPYLHADAARLASYAAALESDLPVFGLTPGDVIVLDETGFARRHARWIRLDRARIAAARRQLRQFASGSGRHMPATPPLADERTLRSARRRIAAELPLLARGILRSPLGAALLAACESLLLEIRSSRGDERVHYVLDLTRSAFVRRRVKDRFQSGYGVSLFDCDFDALLDGRVLIWDLAATAIETWYRRGYTTSVLPFLFTWYCEAMRPSLARKITLNAVHAVTSGGAGTSLPARRPTGASRRSARRNRVL